MAEESKKFHFVINDKAIAEHIKQKGSDGFISDIIHEQLKKHWRGEKFKDPEIILKELLDQRKIEGDWISYYHWRKEHGEDIVYRGVNPKNLMTLEKTGNDRSLETTSISEKISLEKAGLAPEDFIYGSRQFEKAWESARTFLVSTKKAVITEYDSKQLENLASYDFSYSNYAYMQKNKQKKIKDALKCIIIIEDKSESKR